MYENYGYMDLHVVDADGPIQPLADVYDFPSPQGATVPAEEQSIDSDDQPPANYGNPANEVASQPPYSWDPRIVTHSGPGYDPIDGTPYTPPTPSPFGDPLRHY